MSWLLLIIAGIFEVGFTYCLGRANEVNGSELYISYIFFAIFLIISMSLLMKATKKIPIGTAYAVWTGIGAVGTVIMGILVFDEPADFGRIFFISTLIISIAGLKFTSH